jgi:tRNA dimethylallyltransferase
MTIGTAVPDASQLSAVKHYFIHSHTVTELYTAGKYELEALGLINRLFEEGHETLVMAGGSGFYIDALVNGLDDFPSADLQLRSELTSRLEAEGVEALRMELKALGPESYASIDIANGQRVVRALEVCLMTGKPFSSFKTASRKSRDFEVEKIGLTRPRDVLYDRINRRVLQMVDDGLVEEVRSLVQYRDLAALKTVGYKEIFDWFDYEAGLVSADGFGPTTPGDGPVTSLDRAVELIQRNTRRYAKRQLSYWGRDKEIRWMEL